jgi:hypothetical protein
LPKIRKIFFTFYLYLNILKSDIQKGSELKKISG